MAKGQRNEKITPRNSQGAHQPDFGHRAPAPSFPVMGDKHARDDKPTAQTRNRCCILDDLSHRHRSRCNSYIESSKTRTNSAVTVVRGAPALAAAVAPRHRLITTLNVVFVCAFVMRKVAEYEGRPLRSGSGVADGIPGRPWRSGSGVADGIPGRPWRSGSNAADGRHNRRRNRYIDSSKTRTNSAVTVARGAPALAAAVAPRHRLKTTLDVVPYVRSRTDERRINPPANFFSDEQPRRIVSARLICTRCHANVKSVLRCRACGALCPTSRIGSGMLSSRAFAFYVLALVVAAIFWFA